MIRESQVGRDFRTVPRRFSGFTLDVVGYIPRKASPIDMIFTSVNYSLILSGHGTYRCEGIDHEVQSPCVITQLPGLHVQYGPLPGRTWEELFFILPADALSWLRSRGLFGQSAHIWPIRNRAEVVRGANALLSVIERPEQNPGWIDRIDHLAERIVMDTLLPGVDEESDPGSMMVKWLGRTMAAAPGETYDLPEIAREHGLSYSTFQRRWRQQYDLSPGQHLLQLRLSEACRLLVESGMTSAEIGREIGFDDPGYFSRMFKSRIGMPPSRYRRLHRPPA